MVLIFNTSFQKFIMKVPRRLIVRGFEWTDALKYTVEARNRAFFRVGVRAVNAVWAAETVQEDSPRDCLDHFLC